MKHLAILTVLALAVTGCAAGISVADLKSGKYQGTVVKKSKETTSHLRTFQGQSEFIWEHHYYLDIKDNAGGSQRLEVREQAYNAVQEGTKLPLD
jgi:hypothetical protein